MKQDKTETNNNKLFHTQNNYKLKNKQKKIIHKVNTINLHISSKGTSFAGSLSKRWHVHIFHNYVLNLTPA